MERVTRQAITDAIFDIRWELSDKGQLSKDMELKFMELEKLVDKMYSQNKEITDQIRGLLNQFIG